MDTIRDFKFSPEQLKADIAESTRRFKLRVLNDVPAAYLPKLADARAELVEALKVTSDLTNLRPELIAANPHIVRALRYTAGPPISEEDFRTLTAWPFSPTPFGRAVEAAAPEVCRVVRALADPLLFPWVRTSSGASEKDREAAINGTAKLLAVERFRTERRGGASKDQEDQVRRVLDKDAGLTWVPRPDKKTFGHIDRIDHLEMGTFSSECVLYGMKCDVPVRLPDGLLMTIECKVNSGQKNGWKRVSREVEGKAGRWRTKFGEPSVVIAIMLDGNFDLGTLTRFQDEGYFIFWAHDYQRLVDFVNAHTP